MAHRSSTSSSSFGADFGSRLRARPLLVFAILVIGWFAFDRGLSFAMQRVLLGSDYRISRIYSGTIDADVVFVGNSRAAHLFDTQQLSVLTCSKVFNLGIDGIDALTQAALVEDYLDKNRRPSLIVFELSNARADEASVVEEFAPFVPFSDRLRRLIEAEGGWSLAHDVSHLYAFNSPKWWRAAVTWFAPMDQADPPSYGVLNPRLAQTTVIDRRWVVGEKNIAAVHDAMRYALNHDTKVLATLAPYHVSAFGGDQGLQTRYADSVYAQLPEGVTVADLSMSLSRRELFADRVHLNKAGLTELQPKLVEMIKAQIGDRCT